MYSRFEFRRQCCPGKTDWWFAKNYTPNSSSFLVCVKKELGLFTEVEKSRLMQNLNQAGAGERLSVGIKKLLMISEMARQDVDKVDKFFTTLCDTSAGGRWTTKPI